MRLFAATLATETNTFSPCPTSFASHRKIARQRHREHPDDASRMCTAPLFPACGWPAAEHFGPRRNDGIKHNKTSNPAWPLDEEAQPGLIF